MKNVEEIRKRYLKDELPVRLGGIAANLARMKSFSSNDNHLEAIESLLDESKYYIEWTVKDVPVEIQEFLIQIQIQLALWQVQLIKIWIAPSKAWERGKVNPETFRRDSAGK